jgi:DNA-binding NtrC family response regulator
LEYAHKTHNPAPFILMTAVPTMSTAIQAVNLGAYRYIIKTDTLVEELSLTVEQALEELALREENLRLPLAHLSGSVTGITATGLEAIQIPPEGIDFESTVSQVEKLYLQAALQSAGGERRQAAHVLKMSYRLFCHYAKKYGI